MLSQGVSTHKKISSAYREFFEMYFSYTGQSGWQCVESQTLSFSWVNRSSAVAIETAVSFGLLTLASRKHLYASLQICVWRECGSEGRKMWMVKVRCRLKMFVFETSESCVDPYQMYLLNEWREPKNKFSLCTGHISCGQNMSFISLKSIILCCWNTLASKMSIFTFQKSKTPPSIRWSASASI